VYVINPQWVTVKDESSRSMRRTGAPVTCVPPCCPARPTRIDFGAVECTYSDVSNNIGGGFFEATQRVTFANVPLQRVGGSALCPVSGEFTGRTS
jgi:hypothetical protein